MAPNQRLALAIMWSILLVCVGWVFLFNQLITKPEEISTNIQQELDTKLQDEQQLISDNQDQWSSLEPPPNNSVSPENITLPWPFPLTVLLPPRVKQTTMQEMFRQLESAQLFQPIFVQPATYTTYLRAIESMTTGQRQADLILLPRQEINRLDGWWTQIDRSQTPAPTGQFHPQLADLLTSAKSAFIPHALDPRVTVTTTPQTNLSLGTFLQIYPSPLQIPKQAATQHPLLLQISAVWLDQLFRLDNSSLIPKLFLSTTPAPCTLRALCFDSGANALWLPISELVDSSNMPLSFHPFPSLDGTLPTVVWWWVVRGNDNPEKITQRLLWIQQYLVAMSADQLPYESPLLPAYHPRLSRLILQDDLARLQPVIYKLSLITRSHSQLTNRFSLLPLSHLIDGSYRPELYLEKWQEIRTN